MKKISNFKKNIKLNFLLIKNNQFFFKYKTVQIWKNYISWCSIFLSKIAIPQRELKQISSHTQKFYIKLKKCKDIELEIDFTSEHIKNIKDMIHHIKSLNKDYNIMMKIVLKMKNMKILLTRIKIIIK